MNPSPTLTYTIEDEEFQNMPRARVVGRVSVEEGQDANLTGRALADAVHDLLKKHPKAKVALVFGYSPGDDVNGIYTRGVAAGSRDAKGWTGDGLFTNGPLKRQADDGTIIAVVGAPFGDETLIRVER